MDVYARNNIQIVGAADGPLIVLAGRRTSARIGGHAVGLVAEPHFIATRFHLAPGDTLVLYTDGLTEASTGVGHERYDDRGALLGFAQSIAPATASEIVGTVHALLDGLGSGVQDDVAVLALGVPPLNSSE